MSNKQRVLLYLSGLLLIILVWLGANYYLSLRTLTVNYENINSVSIFSTKKLDERDDEKPIKTVAHSGKEIRLKKGSYVLQYDAKDNYQDYFMAIDLTDKHQVINLSPNYSDEYLDKILGGEVESIKKAIEEKYPKIKKIYDIQRGRLYKKGEWYGTTLIYKGDTTGSNLFKTDALRIVLKKENGQWAVKTNPPYILLNRYSYPGIPEDILRSVNALPASPGG